MQMPFDYDAIVQEALLDSVARILDRVSKDGLQNDHHFYITFRTDRPDVKIPEFLRERHPYEVTVVLQHMFWDLKVLKNSFKVTLSFNNTPETIEVPFSALISLVDPSVKFGLHFVPDENPVPPQENTDPKSEAAAASAAKTKADGSNVHPSPEPTLSGDKVVHLDSFRR